jgi:hypothetical protein
MIRRDIWLADGVPRWLLVSQLEHAELSFLLAQRCLPRFGNGVSTPAYTLAVDNVRAELLAAIRRHDDGWGEWETQPKLDPRLRRPLSFRELPLEEALDNWNGSIASAAEAGPLAAWTVAGHFAALLEDSEKEHDKAQADNWLDQTAHRRTAWFMDWQRLNPEWHTPQLAAEALHWLQAFDLLSLWLCSVCPAGGETVPNWPAGYCIAPGSSLAMQVRPDESADHSLSTKVVVEPWRFEEKELTVEVKAQVVPVRQYRDSGDLLAACVPLQLRWRLMPQ